MTDNELVYLFTLDYRPAELQGTPIVRSIAATVGIECHYPRSSVFFTLIVSGTLQFKSFVHEWVFHYRRHNVSSNELQPAWIPYVSTKVVEDILVFSLKIMTGLYFLFRPDKHIHLYWNFTCFNFFFFLRWLAVWKAFKCVLPGWHLKYSGICEPV